MSRSEIDAATPTLPQERPLQVGVVGYSGTPFDQEAGRELVRQALDWVVEHHPAPSYALVSGLTDMGIPALAYREAQARGWRLVGIACKRARKMRRFRVHEQILVGRKWGDESETFLERIDVLVKVGGGRQSIREYAAHAGPKQEWPLDPRPPTPRGQRRRRR